MSRTLPRPIFGKGNSLARIPVIGKLSGQRPRALPSAGGEEAGQGPHALLSADGEEERAEIAHFGCLRMIFSEHRGTLCANTALRARIMRYSGSGMNSCSCGTGAKRPDFQSCFACSIRSLLEETKFHQMWRGPSSASPPRSIMRVGLIVFTVMRSPGRKTRSLGPS